MNSCAIARFMGNVEASFDQHLQGFCTYPGDVRYIFAEYACVFGQHTLLQLDHSVRHMEFSRL